MNEWKNEWMNVSLLILCRFWSCNLFLSLNKYQQVILCKTDLGVRVLIKVYFYLFFHLFFHFFIIFIQMTKHDTATRIAWYDKGSVCLIAMQCPCLVLWLFSCLDWEKRKKKPFLCLFCFWYKRRLWLLLSITDFANLRYLIFMVWK